MRRRWKVLIGTGVALLVLASILLVTQLGATSYTSLQTALRAHGASVQDDGQGSEPFLTGTDHRLIVNGVGIDVFEYPTTFGASLDGSHISSDGATISVHNGPFGSVTTVDFVAPPHWFRAGRVIVLYVGQSTALLNLLQAVLGPQFAGSRPGQLETR
jgi:hypothetical protein